MSGERCRDANLPSEPSMRRANTIAIIECGGTKRWLHFRAGREPSEPLSPAI